jgi:hypothetical protein
MPDGSLKGDMQQEGSAQTPSIGHQTEDTRGPMSLPRRWLRVKRIFARMNIAEKPSLTACGRS